MFTIDRRDKRRRTGVVYNPNTRTNLLNKANFVLMNGKITPRQQFMGVNFKDDVQSHSYVNIAQAGYAFDAAASRKVVSNSPQNTANAAASMVNLRQLIAFLALITKNDPKLGALLQAYRRAFATVNTVRMADAATAAPPAQAPSAQAPPAQAPPADLDESSRSLVTQFRNLYPVSTVQEETEVYPAFHVDDLTLQEDDNIGMNDRYKTQLIEAQAEELIIQRVGRLKKPRTHSQLKSLARTRGFEGDDLLGSSLQLARRMATLMHAKGKITPAVSKKVYNELEEAKEEALAQQLMDTSWS